MRDWAHGFHSAIDETAIAKVIEFLRSGLGLQAYYTISGVSVGGPGLVLGLATVIFQFEEGSLITF